MAQSDLYPFFHQFFELSFFFLPAFISKSFLSCSKSAIVWLSRLPGLPFHAPASIFLGKWAALDIACVGERGGGVFSLVTLALFLPRSPDRSLYPGAWLPGLHYSFLERGVANFLTIANRKSWTGRWLW